MNFESFFKACGEHDPRPYQTALATSEWPETLIIPTGFGKTAAVLAAWIWKIGHRKDPGTPRRLIYCLPMRSLVEQTEAVARTWIEKANETFGVKITLDVLMGGRSEGRRGLPAWMFCPDCPAILIGTQDMLISAALMRGYGTSRYRWPVDFALLHNDVLWVFDEVQLTGATLPTSAQLEAFRRKLGSGRASRTLWMSATLDPQWLKTVDFTPKDSSRCHDLNDEDFTGTGHLWTARKQLKPLDLDASLESRADELAKRAVNKTKLHSNTIIFLNTVAKAKAVCASLKAVGFAGKHLLIKSQIRGADRARLIKRLQTDAPEQGRIIVTTQALKAGVDVTSATMMKEGLKSYADELASRAVNMAKPHTNTIIFLNTVARAQAVFASIKEAGEFAGEHLLIHSRFRGNDRARLMTRLQKGAPERGRIIVATQALEAGVDVTSATMITEIAPWSSLVQRFGRCNRYGECGEAGAEIFWIDLPDTQTMPYTAEECEAARQHLEKLSDCGPQNLAAIRLGVPEQYNVIRKRDLIDLFDTDPDLSGFDVDVSLYIRDADDTDVRLFWRKIDADGPTSEEAAPFGGELCPAPIGNAKQLLKRKDVRAWVWDTLLAQWRAVDKDSVFPGMTLMMDSACGGYDPDKGFDPTAKKTVEPVPASSGQEADRTIDNDEDTTSRVRVSLAKHSLHARDEAERLASQLKLTDSERDILVKCALWHDLGKAHDVFKARCGLGQQDPPLAKTPDYDWRGTDERNRPCFRHELASALAYLAKCGWKQEADLPAYLIAAHHGKVRMRLRALPNEKRAEDGRLFARGVWDGDKLPQTDLGGMIVPETKLDLDLMQLGEGRFGPSWSARCQALLKQYGPFRLAFLEALLRIADWRASKAEEDAGHDDL